MFLFVVHFSATWNSGALVTLWRSQSLPTLPRCSLSTPWPYLMFPCPNKPPKSIFLLKPRYEHIVQIQCSSSFLCKLQTAFTKDFHMRCIDNVSETHASARPRGSLLRPHGFEQSNKRLRCAGSAQKASQELAGCSGDLQEVLGALKSYLH